MISAVGKTVVSPKKKHERSARCRTLLGGVGRKNLYAKRVNVW